MNADRAEKDAEAQRREEQRIEELSQRLRVLQFSHIRVHPRSSAVPLPCHIASGPILYTAAVLQPFDIVALLVLGLFAGALGGMLGIGGSVIMIPVLTVELRRDHQLSQAVAMIVNVFVSLPAVLQHRRAK